ncbi:MAG: GYD domain-containing protein [Thermoplasmata archaeon]
MAKYVVVSKLTDEGRKTIKKNPERILEVNEEMEKKGVKVLQQYALLGKYDFITILETPDHHSITNVVGEMSSRGTIRTVTMPAMTIEEFIGAMDS